jgi:hypothetical protein
MGQRVELAANIIGAWLCIHLELWNGKSLGFAFPKRGTFHIPDI